MHVQSFFWKHPDVETVILRPAHIIGAVRNAPSNYLRLSRPWTVGGFDPMIQVIHEDDAARAIECALTPGVQGIFNIVGCQPAPLSQLIRLSGARPVRIPHLVADGLLNRLFSMRLTSFPAPELDHLRYVCMVDGDRARRILEFEARYSLEETMEYLRMTRIAMSGLRP